MSDRRYTVTEGQLIDFAQSYHRITLMGENYRTGDTVEALIATLTPDPEPSGEVVEKLKDWISYYKDDNIPVPLASMLHGLTIDGLARRLANLLTAEVARQVEERTKGYREALEKIIRYDEKILTQYVGEYAVRVAKEALANKGGSDE